ncbi:MAG: hypothetical protein WAV11_02065 [Minisyncoccia bacterium]
MPKATKKDKFFFYAKNKTGYLKDKILFGENSKYTGGPLTLQDVIDFLKEKGIDPSRVELPRGYSAFAKK